MRYPEHVIEQIRDESDIVSIISEYTNLTKKGQSYVGLCPFHHEKTPSFSVSEEKQLYYCFGCGAGGNVITFLMQKENMTFVEAVQYLAERHHIKLEGEYLSEEEIETNKKKVQLLEILKESARYFHYSLRADENKEALTYLTERSLSLETIKHFGLGFSSYQYNDLYHYLKQKGYQDDLLVQSGLIIKSQKNGVCYDRFAGRIIYPIFDLTAKVIAFGGRVLDGSQPKYLNSSENILFNKSRTLYGMHLAKNSGAPYFILVEGYMDVIAMHQAGFSQTVASLGTAFTAGHARLLKRYTKEVVILYDSDAAGQKAATRAIPILRAEGLKVKVLTLKEGKDPDEYLKTHGYEAMKNLLEQAPSDIWFQVRQIEKEYTLTDAEQKIQFLQQVALLLSKTTSSIEQSIYTEEICKQYEIDLEAFKVEINRNYRRDMREKRTPIKSDYEPVRKKQEFNHEVIFLANLYHYPLISRQIIRFLKPEMFEGELLSDLCKAIIEMVSEGQPVDLAYFTKKYPEPDEQNIISHVLIFKDDRYEDPIVLKKMVTENIKRLNDQYLKKCMKQSKDIQEVQNLLLQKKELDKLNIDYING